MLLFGHHQVLGLDVTMHHTLAVHVLNSFQNLLEYLASLVLGVFALLLLCNAVQHLHSVNKLQNLVDFSLEFIVKVLDCLHDVDMV